MAHEKMALVLGNGNLSFWLALSYVLFQNLIKVKKIKVIQVNIKEQLLINYKKFFQLLEALKTQSPFTYLVGRQDKLLCFFIRTIRQFQIISKSQIWLNNRFYITAYVSRLE